MRLPGSVPRVSWREVDAYQALADALATGQERERAGGIRSGQSQRTGRGLI